MADPPRQPEAGQKRRLWERLRTGRLASWWTSLLRDYAEACREAALGVRRRPGRAGLCAAVLAGAACCGARCPGEASFEAGLLEAAGQLLLLSPRTRSSAAEAHVERLLALRSREQLRFRSLALASLVYEAPFPAGAGLYRARCPHLRPRPADFPRRLLDVGFCGRWWVLRARMRDPDVRHEEFRHLPARLQQLSPRRDLRSERNERLFQEKYRPVVLSPEQLLRAEREDQDAARKTKGPRALLAQ